MHTMKADELTALRCRLGWSQGELATRLGVWRETVNKWENGRRPIALRTAIAIRALALAGSAPTPARAA